MFSIPLTLNTHISTLGLTKKREEVKPRIYLLEIKTQLRKFTHATSSGKVISLQSFS